MKQSLFKIGLFIAIIALFSACDAWKNDIRLNDEMRGKNLYEAIASNTDLSVFAQILQQTSYDKFLQNEQGLTVFAPQNSVLAGLNLTDTTMLKEWIKNYIAYYSYYVNESGNFDTGSTIRMINEKNVPVNAAGISGAGLVKSNVATSNGVLHIIDNMITDRKNILEYLLEQNNFGQIDFIRSEDRLVMDMDRSVQTGVDANGQPTYDKVMKTQNDFLTAFPLGDESLAFNVILLEPTALDKLKTKYAKYMHQDDAVKQAKEIISQITKDLILNPENIDHVGRYLSMNGDSLLVDINPSAIVETYQASNGKVYKVNDIDIKMYENKIKTKIIEAEDYTDRWDGQDGWEVRYRSWARGGKDVTLKGQTRSTFTYYRWNVAGDSVQTVTETRTFNMIHRSNEGFVSKSNNAYLKYEPEMFSVPYEIYWRTYDDKSSHIYSVTGKLYATGGKNAVPLFTVNGTDTILYTQRFPMLMEQKMLISFPGKPALRRNSNGTISNNFTAYSMMASESVAGVSGQIQLKRYRTAAIDSMFMLATSLTAPLLPYTSADDFGQNKILNCPAYGKATIFVSNTIREKDTNAGVLFLDYIRLVPLVDPND
ncbi:MAG TPA: fasciclin domain-containing protein [Bacteroidales bacterium]|nr:fasciclin domain-containing protein [Bacteroidales bacterium]